MIGNREQVIQLSLKISLVIIKGGVDGDIATAAMVVNSIPKVVSVTPGLLTMKDIPIVTALPNM